MTQATSFWHGRRVLVTGCTGFLGGAVARELFVRGAEVVGLTDERITTDTLRADFAGRLRLVHGRGDNVFRLHSAMAVHEVSAIFHLAPPNPFEDRGTAALLQAVNLYSRRVPVVATRAIPQLSLADAEPREERLSFVRFGEVFGPGDRNFTRVVPATATALHSSEAATPADGPARDFVFVRDAARACLLAAEDAVRSGPRDHTFRSGWQMTDRQMACVMRDVIAARSVELPDTASPRNPLGWAPAQPLAEALSETLEWYRAFAHGNPARRAA